MKAFIASLVLFMTMPTMAAAADDGGWYMGIGAGQSALRDVCSLVGPTATCDDEPVGWKVFAGRDMSKYFGLELSYTDAGEAKIVDSSATPGTLNIRPKLVTASAKLELPLGSRFSLLGKVGLTYFSVDYERTGVFQALSSGDDGLEPSLGAGFAFKLSKRVAIRAEWEHFNDAVGLASGDIDMATASLLYHF